MSSSPAGRPQRHRQDNYYHSSADESDSPRPHSRSHRRSTRPSHYHRSSSYSPSFSSSTSPPHRSYQGGPHTSTRTRSGGHKYDTLGKASIAVGILQLVAGILQLWSTKKAAKKDEEDSERRRRDFAKRKRDRRREEDRWARQKEWDRQRDAEVAAMMSHGRVRGLIGPADPGRSRSRSVKSRDHVRRPSVGEDDRGPGRKRHRSRVGSG